MPSFYFTFKYIYIYIYMYLCLFYVLLFIYLFWGVFWGLGFWDNCDDGVWQLDQKKVSTRTTTEMPFVLQASAAQAYLPQN